MSMSFSQRQFLIPRGVAVVYRTANESGFWGDKTLGVRSTEVRILMPDAYVFGRRVMLMTSANRMQKEWL